jgi:phage/plasmid-associated DNA primase
MTIVESIENFKSQGVKVIPVHYKRKNPDVPDFGKYLSGEKEWTDEISGEQNYGVLTGKQSDNLVIMDVEKIDPVDYHTKAENPKHIPVEENVISNIIPNWDEKTLVTKTGSGGFHLIYKVDKLPPKTKSFIWEKSHDDIYKIDFKSTGMCVEAGSIHPNGEPYKVVSDVSIIATVETHYLLKRIEKCGFRGIVKSGKTENNKSSISLENYDLDDLMKGGWERGTRRAKFKSLYVKLRFKGNTENESRDVIKPIMGTLPEPLDNNEIEEYFTSAEDFYQGVKEDEVVVVADGDNSKLWKRFIDDCIIEEKIVVKSTIFEAVGKWNYENRFEIEGEKIYPIKKGEWKGVHDYIAYQFEDIKVFPIIKENCFEHGRNDDELLFDKDQVIEVAEYTKGRHYVKRIDLGGTTVAFDGKCYDDNSDEQLKRYAREYLIKTTNNSVKETLGFTKETCDLISQEEIEAHAHLKCTNNGTYDVKTGIFTESFSPDNIILNLIPRNYDPKKSWDKIRERVEQIIPDEKDRQSYYDALSLALHPYNGIDMQFGMVSEAGTGKSQLAHLVKMVLGADNVSGVAIQSLATDATTQQDTAYQMMNVDSEMQSDDIHRLDIMKKWITQDEFTARAIYLRNAKFRPSTRLMFMTNNLYELPNRKDAEAMYERTHLIKLTHKFRGTKDEVRNIFKVIENVEDELDGFITYLLDNMTWIWNNQNIHYRQSTNDTERIWNEFGNNITQFIDTWIKKDATYKQEKTLVLTAWLDYADKHGIPTEGRNKFYEKFEDIAGVGVDNIRPNSFQQYKGYHGIALRTQEEVDKIANHVDTPKEALLKVIGKMRDSTDIRFALATTVLTE